LLYLKLVLYFFALTSQLAYALSPNLDFIQSIGDISIYFLCVPKGVIPCFSSSYRLSISS